MNPRDARATRIGLFVVVGLVLVISATLLVAGDKVFSRKEAVVMNFADSIYGLQVGAPVVFRGVPLGNVTSIGLVYDGANERFTIPVRAEIDRDTIRSLLADGKTGQSTLSITDLIAKGLRAQLSMQSLLTGQLYVDLDLRPKLPARFAGHDPRTVEIPTAANAIQNLKAQLDGMDFKQLFDNVSTVAQSARELATGPALKQSLDDLRQLSANLRRLSARLDKRVQPLADAAQRTLADARHTMGELQGTADAVSDTARRFGGTADRASALLAPDSPTLRSLQHSADELAQAAQALRQQASGEAPLAQNFDRTLLDVARAARAVRQLADLLEQQPQSLLRGKSEPAPAQ